MADNILFPVVGPGTANVTGASKDKSGVHWQKVGVEFIDEAGALYGVMQDGNMPHGITISHAQAVGEGILAGHTPLLKFGGNEDVSTSEEIIASQGGVLLYPAGGAVLHIVSASAADDLTGTGARTVEVFGLNDSYVEISETVDLDGAGAGFVATVNDYLRVYRMVVKTAGAGEKSAGLITAQNIAENEIYLQIDIGLNKSLAGQWTVPATKTLFINQLDFSSAATKGSRFRVYARPENEVFQLEYQATLFAATEVIPFQTLLVFAAKSDIQLRAQAILTGDNVTGTLHGWYE